LKNAIFIFYCGLYRMGFENHLKGPCFLQKIQQAIRWKQARFKKNWLPTGASTTKPKPS
jgi:hypothetical protein